jgi:hypothetical protein
VIARHRDAADVVRFSVAAALPAIVDEKRVDDRAIQVLIALSADADADTRYYACAALVDDLALVHRPEVRDAIERLGTDTDSQIRRAPARALSGGTWGEDGSR